MKKFLYSYSIFSIISLLSLNLQAQETWIVTNQQFQCGLCLGCDIDPGSFLWAFKNASNGDTIDLRNMSGELFIFLSEGLDRETGNSIFEVLNKSLVIIGPGSENLTLTSYTSLISCLANSRLFYIDKESKLELIGLTLESFSPFYNSAPGFESHGGTIYNEGSLILDDITISNSRVDSLGGAIYNLGSIEIQNSLFSNCNSNTFADFGSNIEKNMGGAIYSEGKLKVRNTNFSNCNSTAVKIINNTIIDTLSNCLFRSNTGGAIYGNDIYVEFTDFIDNISDGGFGGAITAKNLNIRNTNFISNSAKFGGAINTKNAKIYNCYFNANIADNTSYNSDIRRCYIGGGSAIANYLDDYDNFESGNIEIENSTFNENISRVFAVESAILLIGADSLKVKNSTFYNNPAIYNAQADICGAGYGLIPDTYISFNSCTVVGNHSNHSFDEFENSLIISPQLDFQKINTNLCGKQEDIKISSLRNNGGPTPTIALLLDENGYNPAINNGSELNYSDLDQRGTPRRGAFDYGAFEYQEVEIVGISNQEFCIGGEEKSLNDILIFDSTGGGFQTGENQSFLLALPPGYQFEQTNGNIEFSDGIELAGTPSISSSTFFFNYNRDSTINPQLIIITGLKVKASELTIPGESKILRIGGSAVQYGNSRIDSLSHGNLIAISPPSIPRVPDVFLCLGNKFEGFSIPPSEGYRYRWYANSDTSEYIQSGSFFFPDVDLSRPISYDFYVTNTSNGCPSKPDTVSLSINDRPLPPEIINAPDPICPGDSITIVEVATQGGDRFIWYSDKDMEDSISGGKFFRPSGFQFDYNNPGIKNYYVSQILNGCESASATKVTFEVRGLLEFDFSIDNGCQNEIVRFENLTEEDGKAYTWIWDFGDGSNLNIDKSPSHFYNNGGLYQVKLVGTDEFGCKDSVEKPLSISSAAIANFSWSNSCIGQEILFADRSVIDVGIIGKWEWDFGDGILSKEANPKHFYDSPGDYEVILFVDNNQGCINSDTQIVSIFPTYKPRTDNIYTEDFQATEIDWKTNNSSSIWNLSDWGNNEGNKSWNTKFQGELGYPSNSNSLLYSPCFDISLLDRPMVSLDYFSDTEDGFDGTVLEISNNGGISWKPVGNFLDGFPSGPNWYNNPLVTSEYGIGWSGFSNEKMLNAKHKLDNFKKDSQLIQFRLSFTSNDTDPPGTSFDGFAFDNFQVKNRQNKVVLEYFGNYEDSQYLSSKTIIDSLANSNKNDLIILEYHPPFPKEDIVYLRSPEIHNSRTFFYKVFEANRTIIGGNDFNSRISALTQRDLDFVMLEDSDFTIHAEFSEEERAKNAVIQIFSNNFIDKEELILSLILLENEDSYIVKEIVPNSAGYYIQESWHSGKTKEIKLSWEDANISLDSSTYVILLQNLKTGEVYSGISNQTINNNSPIFTNLEETIQRNTISIFPNPSKLQTGIYLNKKLKKALQWKLFSLQGVMVKNGIIEAGKEMEIINTENMSPGVYILDFPAIPFRKKILVGN